MLAKFTRRSGALVAALALTAGAAPAWAGTLSLTGVHVSGTQVNIQLDGARYRVVSDRDGLVILDLPGSHVRNFATVDVRKGGVRRVRIGNVRAGVARLVLETDPRLVYRFTPGDGGITCAPTNAEGLQLSSVPQSVLLSPGQAVVPQPTHLADANDDGDEAPAPRPKAAVAHHAAAPAHPSQVAHAAPPADDTDAEDLAPVNPPAHAPHAAKAAAAAHAKPVKLAAKPHAAAADDLDDDEAPAPPPGMSTRKPAGAAQAATDAGAPADPLSLQGMPRSLKVTPMGSIAYLFRSFFKKH